MSCSAISTNSIERFHKLHAGEKCLLVGNGINLHRTPPAWFDLPAIGMNTIHKYNGWKPTYYTTVDSRVMREFGNEINDVYRDVPKFLPTPNLDKWQGENIYRFYHRPGALWQSGNGSLNYAGLLAETGITYANIMHVAMQLAYYMGFTTLLMVGVQHKPMKAQDHFWGCDHGMGAEMPLDDWFAGYKTLADGLRTQGVKVFNISEDTCVPDEILPRDDWRNYAKSTILTGFSG